MIIYIRSSFSDVYGFKMSCMKSPSLVEASVEIVKPENVISEPVEIIR